MCVGKSGWRGRHNRTAASPPHMMAQPPRAFFVVPWSASPAIPCAELAASPAASARYRCAEQEALSTASLANPCAVSCRLETALAVQDKPTKRRSEVVFHL